PVAVRWGTPGARAYLLSGGGATRQAEFGIGVPLMSCPFVPSAASRRAENPQDLADSSLRRERGARRGTAARSRPRASTGGHDEHDEEGEQRGQARGVGQAAEAPLRPLASPVPRTRWDHLYGPHRR